MKINHQSDFPSHTAKTLFWQVQTSRDLGVNSWMLNPFVHHLNVQFIIKGLVILELEFTTSFIEYSRLVTALQTLRSVAWTIWRNWRFLDRDQSRTGSWRIDRSRFSKRFINRVFLQNSRLVTALQTLRSVAWTIWRDWRFQDRDQSRTGSWRIDRSRFSKRFINRVFLQNSRY
jgi:hypothetical protein